jgi:hypothetical protein
LNLTQTFMKSCVINAPYAEYYIFNLHISYLLMCKKQRRTRAQITVVISMRGSACLVAKPVVIKKALVPSQFKVYLSVTASHRIGNWGQSETGMWMKGSR